LKQLHKLLIKTFIKPLVATFFVAQFILILQFLWQHIDDLAGKGLEWQVIAELLLYASASLVPLALPLAVLLSSIMTFGNLGESLELTAIKSSGISLQKFMKPLIILVTFLSIGGFFYANHVIPYANLKALSLKYDIKKQREELQIREGIFYNDIEGYSIKVGHKNPRTKLMKDIMIYQHDKDIGNAQVTVADSGYIKMTTDETKLLVILYNGKTFEEMEKGRKSNSRRDEKKYPYQERKFDKETLLLDISGFNFKRTDEGLFKDNYQMLKLSELKKNKDSLVEKYNNRALELSKELDNNVFMSDKFKSLASRRRDPRVQTNSNNPNPGNQDSNNIPGQVSSKRKNPDTNQTTSPTLLFARTDSNFRTDTNKYLYSLFHSEREKKVNYVLRNDSAENDLRSREFIASKTKPPKNEGEFDFETFFDSLSTDKKTSIIHHALGNARRNSKNITNSKRIFEQRQKNIYKHQIYWHKKLTLSFACIIFFFIGAPLGSIIRKGGLGTPLVISVILFIIYYIISITGENFVEKGVLPAVAGMWLSSLIFLPVGIFLTYKATNDSMILNTETYMKTIKKILSLRIRKNGESEDTRVEDFHEQTLG
jgi:lipopolysaccharide export system permease protein